jgi:hypothetical protein
MQVRSIMSTAASSAVAVGNRHDKPLADVRVRLRAKFYRFLRELPERYDPVDPEVLKRVPVPI